MRSRLIWLLIFIVCSVSSTKSEEPDGLREPPPFFSSANAVSEWVLETRGGGSLPDVCRLGSYYVITHEPFSGRRAYKVYVYAPREGGLALVATTVITVASIANGWPRVEYYLRDEQLVAYIGGKEVSRTSLKGSGERRDSRGK